MKKQIRCAIYTRKSTEEGLEQDFNSLDAQREACESFIKSQKHEGWVLVKKEYNDGGFSGGTIDRPAFKELLDDIQNDKIDIVVVYKVDRLTRSLMDFSKIIDIFDKHNTSFVSITQQFNTTTSMGRLTLNILLSFAQFEREVTGERIRDKFAASKKKGLWMGGTVPLGYDQNKRTLKINEEDSIKIKTIFEKYIELKSVTKLKEYLKENNIKTRINRDFSKGHLYYILKNPIYNGKIIHKSKIYDGEHPAIIDDVLFENVQKILVENRREHEYHGESNSLLKSLLYNDKGNIMTPTHSRSKKKKYRYYITSENKSDKVTKIPAEEIENIITEEVTSFLKQPSKIQEYITDLDFKHQAEIIKHTTQLTEIPGISLREIVFKVILHPNKIEIILKKNMLLPILKHLTFGELLPITTETETEFISLEKTITIKRIASKGKILIINESNKKPNYNLPMIKALTRSYYWNDLLATGDIKNINGILALEKINDKKYVRKVLKLRFLPKDIQESILNGRQDVAMSLKGLFA